MTTLNRKQLQAVRSIDRPTLVLAGAGSGKTSVITRKIAWLIDECGLKARHIAAVTFTNKAAREMNERVRQLIPREKLRGLTVCTFHTLGLNIIRSELEAAGLRSGFSIFDREDSRTLLKELGQQSGELDPELIDFVLNTIGQLKNELLTPAMAIQQAENAQEQMLANLYDQYQQALKAYNAVDFDDLINMPVQLFVEQPAILQKWRQRIRYLLVDEYQDTNNSQYELVRLLVGDRSGLTVVGDDDQSIYAWRGARPENLVRLQDDFPAMTLIKLEQNYRSTGIILHAANTLIANNPHMFEKKLWSELGHGEEIRIIRVADDRAEAERIVNDIIAHRLRRNNHYRDYAILYRGNHQARILEVALQAANLPYKISGGTSFFARSEIKDIMAYLRLIANPSDDNAFLRIINVPRRKIGPGTLQTLAGFAGDRQQGLYNSIAEPSLADHLPTAGYRALKGFYDWLETVRRQCENSQPMDAINEMVDDIGYLAWLHQNSASSAAAEKRMQNVNFLLENLENALLRVQEDDDEAGIKDAVNRLILRDMLDQQADDDDDDNSIQLLTLHASKGLEYPHVYMVGMEEELLPHRVSIEQDDIEEERRLTYVGITRAQRTLTMTYTSKRKQFGEVIDTVPSRFLDELPTEHLHWPGRYNDENRSQETAEQTLADLKNLFE